MKIELHIIQNFSPSCLNRDDTNSPKECEFGGFRRARVSSQCLKRSIRTSSIFEYMLSENIGVRTKLLVNLLRERLISAGKEPEEVDIVVPAFVEKFSGLSDQKTKVLLYLGKDEIERMNNKLLERWNEIVNTIKTGDKSTDDGKQKKKASKDDTVSILMQDIVKESRLGTKAVDIAMFGRMVAESPIDNIDAACQVAHAISTNRLNMEMDFYTAIDDLLPEGDTGAGMMGTIGFNSSCFYRYSLVDLDQLVKNLGDDVELAKTAVEAFIKASIKAIPSGKQTSMAAHNLPSFVMVVLRDAGTPWSLANAFEMPVVPDMKIGGDLISKSISRFDDYWSKLVKMYGSEGIVKAAVCMLDDVELKNTGDYSVESISEMISVVREALK